MTIDHKELLRKYIAHVTECEGIAFLWHMPQEFSDEEKRELMTLAGWSAEDIEDEIDRRRRN